MILAAKARQLEVAVRECRAGRGAVVRVIPEPYSATGFAVEARLPMPSRDSAVRAIADGIETAVGALHPIHSAFTRRIERSDGAWLTVTVPLA